MPTDAELQAQEEDLKLKMQERELTLKMQQRAAQLKAQGSAAGANRPPSAPPSTPKNPGFLGGLLQSLPTPFGATVGEIRNIGGAVAGAYNRAKSGINAFVNTETKDFGTPMGIPHLITNLPAAVSEGVKAAKSDKSVPVDVLQRTVKPTDPLIKRVAAKAGDFFIDAGTDPLNLLLMGPGGDLLNEAAVMGRNAVASKVLSIPPVAKAVQRMKDVVSPVLMGPVGQSVNRALGALGFGPQHTMTTTLLKPYNQEIAQQGHSLAEALNSLNAHAETIMRDPATRKTIENYYTATKQNPLLELTRARLESMAGSPSLAQLEWPNLASKAKQLGIDPQVVRDAADSIRGTYEGARKLLVKTSTERQLGKGGVVKPIFRRDFPNSPLQITDPAEIEKFHGFLDEVLGPKAKAGPRAKFFKTNEEVAGLRVDPAVVRQSQVRQLVQDLPTKGSQWVQPIDPTQGVREGWVGVTEKGGPLDALYGYQMPKVLHRILNNELAKAALVPAHQVSSEYIGIKDTAEAILRATVGTAKKWDIGNLPTQIGNLTGNLGQQNIALRTARVRVTKAEQVAQMARGMKEAFALRRGGPIPKDLEGMLQHSSSLLNTQLDESIGTPSRLSGNLPTVIGSGRLSAVLPKPTGLTARVFGTGKQGTAAAAGLKALSMLNPSEHLANFQNVAEVGTKIATYRMLRQKLGEEAATALTEKVHFDYADRGALLEMADRFGISIFNTFPIKAFNLLMDTVVNHPAELARFARLRKIAIGDDEPTQNRNIPDYQRNSLFTVPVKGGYVNLSRFSTFGGPVDWLSNMAQGTTAGKEAQSALDKSIYSSAGYAIAGNKSYQKEDRGHEKLLQEGQPGNELGGLQRGELGKTYLPSLLPGGRSYGALQNAVAPLARSLAVLPAAASRVPGPPSDS